MDSAHHSREMAGNWDAQSHDQKIEIKNNCKQNSPRIDVSWIQLAMESESMVEKGINFIFCLGTAYDISRMESVGSSKSFSLVRKVCLSKCFLSLNFCFELWHLYKSLLPFAKGLCFTLCNFYL